MSSHSFRRFHSQGRERPRTSNGIRKRAVVAIALCSTVMGLATVSAMVNAPAASASAYSCTGYGVGWKYGHPAQFCARTVGHGTYVETAGAGFSAPIAWTGWLVNTRLRLEFIDTRGSIYLRGLSSQHNGGSSVGAWRWRLNRTVRRGTVRYTLLSNGVQVAAVQQTIR